MMTLTHNNHFKFGYNNNWFNFRTSAEDKWAVSYGACERPVSTFHDECLATAKLIRDTTDGPLNVLFSGGSESEIIVRSFKEAGIPIRVSICQFKNNLNLHDISHAIVCCLQLGIRYNIVQLDINSFLDNGDFLPYAEATCTRTPELCSTMWLADQVEGLPIIGSGECIIMKRVPEGYVDGVSPYEPTPWHIQKRETFLGLYRHFLVPGKERNAVPGFFLYTPEIIQSFLKDQKVVDLVNDRMYGKRSTVSSKLGIYQQHFPLAERRKFHGFEWLNQKVQTIRKDLWSRWPDAGAVFLTEYNDLIDMTEGRKEGPIGILEAQTW